MKLRHEIITFPGPSFALRRTLPDGRRLVWTGRHVGWAGWYGYATGPQPKRYREKGTAKRALTSILRHERELGLAGRYYVVAD